MLGFETIKTLHGKGWWLAELLIGRVSNVRSTGCASGKLLYSLHKKLSTSCKVLAASGNIFKSNSISLYRMAHAIPCSALRLILETWNVIKHNKQVLTCWYTIVLLKKETFKFLKCLWQTMVANLPLYSIEIRRAIRKRLVFFVAAN
jgi:hypothetical protein